MYTYIYIVDLEFIYIKQKTKRGQITIFKMFTNLVELFFCHVLQQ